MITSWTPSEQIIARVIRNTGGQLPGGFISELIEWLDEATRQLETRWTLEKASSPCLDCPGALWTKGHVATLPCGMIALLAVEDINGRRVHYGLDDTDMTRQSALVHGNYVNARATNFQMDVSQTTGTDPAEDGPSVPTKGEDIVPIQSGNVSAYYQISGNKIQTSEEEMFVRLHYLKVPTDDKGWPLIPDNENYKQATFFYIMKQLIAAGYEHTIWKGIRGYDYCEQMFEKYSARAIEEIKYPSVDAMESLRVSWAERLIFPYSRWEDFGVGYEQYQGINKI